MAAAMSPVGKPRGDRLENGRKKGSNNFFMGSRGKDSDSCLIVKPIIIKGLPLMDLISLKG
jgi:hypothetical protein